MKKKRRVFWAIIIFCVGLSLSAQEKRELFSIAVSQGYCSGKKVLSQGWRFLAVKKFSQEYLKEDYDDSKWLRVEVPSQWQTYPGLERYQGKGVYRLKFLVNRSCSLSRYFLRFNGVFYSARVWLNGKYLGEHQGYFEPFEFDITDLVRQGYNLLVVEVECRREKLITAKEQILGVFGYWDVISSYRNPGGIWLPVELITRSPAWLGDIYFTTLEVSPQPRVKISAQIKGKSLPGLLVKFRLVPDNFSGKKFSFTIPVQNGKAEGEFTLEGARLWFTWERGFPHCYRLIAQLLCSKETMKKMIGKKSGSGSGMRIHSLAMLPMVMDKKELLVGIRKIEVKDRFHFLLNGKSLYIRGNNYAPSDVYLSRTTKELVEKDVQMFQQANYNMVRVHAHIDHPYFYTACDRAGILVWQDGPFQWGYSHKIIDEAVRQTKAYVKLLYNHPCIALWCVHNEPLPAGINLTRPNPIDVIRTALTGILWGNPEMLKTEWNYNVLDKELVKAVKSIDQSRPVVQGSGMDRWDTHIYFGWYNGKVDDFARWLEKAKRTSPQKLRFFTEFGAQAFPSYKHTKEMLGTDEIKNLPKKKMLLEYMWQWYVMPRYIQAKDYPDLKSYVQATQEYQARLLKYHIERIRLLKYQPNYGVLCFLHNDSHPAITWSVVDWWREPKKAYYEIARSFSPIWVFTLFRFAEYQVGEEVEFPIYLVNDTLENYPKVKVFAKLPDGEIREFSSSLEPDMLAKKVASVKIKFEQPGVKQLILRLCYGEREIQNSYQLEVRR